uniref:Secreted protein n=1 Tax=Achlya hypogyna TaxID=1202772 RepID=A0A0A7CMI3_ACHHY|nr:secreted protein [Achlya hypogyna]
MHFPRLFLAAAVIAVTASAIETSEDKPVLRGAQPIIGCTGCFFQWKPCCGIHPEPIQETGTKDSESGNGCYGCHINWNPCCDRDPNLRRQTETEDTESGNGCYGCHINWNPCCDRDPNQRQCQAK